MSVFYQDKRMVIYNSEVLECLRSFGDESVQCVITSPPYWGLRDYKNPKQIGLEKTPEEYIDKLVRTFREVRRVLKEDGTLWMNLGDSYANDGKYGGETGGKQYYLGEANRKRCDREKRLTGLKPKDMVGIPWRVALAFQADGWWLRSDIIWHKPNPMPESVTDRPTKAHEYMFLFSKSQTYYYDYKAIQESCLSDNDFKTPSGWVTSTGNGGHGAFHKDGRQKSKIPQSENFRREGKEAERPGQNKTQKRLDRHDTLANGKRNKRTVWTIPTVGFSGAHYATFPPKLVTPCILAGSKPGDTVMDIFHGFGTTGEVCLNHQRKYIGIELNESDCELSMTRFRQGTLTFHP